MTKTNSNTNHNNAFAEVLRQFENAYENKVNKNDNAYSQALDNLATAVTYAVLKKCIQSSGNQTLQNVRRDLARAKHDIGAIKYANDNAYVTSYDTNGNQVTNITDKNLHNALSKLTADTLGEGLDLVNTAIIAILEEVQAQKLRDAGKPIDLERTYDKRQLKKRVWFKMEDSVGGWETVETTPIQEVYRSVRRAVQQSSAMTTPNNGYTYLEDLATDPDTDIDTIIYRRLYKYADLGGAVRNTNGVEVAYTVDKTTVMDADEMLMRLNPTNRQMEIIRLRMQGKGYKQIATYLGITPGAVQSQMMRLRKRCEELGIIPKDED